MPRKRRPKRLNLGSRQQRTLSSLPDFYSELSQLEGTLASTIFSRLDPLFLEHFHANRLDVQSNLSKKYSTETRLVVGKKSKAFNIGNGHMLTVIEVDRLILAALASGQISSVHDPAFTVTHKIHGRCLLLRVDLVNHSKILTVCSRKGPAIALFCRSDSSIEERIWVESSDGGGPYRLDPIDDRITDEKPKSWTQIDPVEFRTIHKLMDRLFQAVEQTGHESLTFLAEGSRDNMDTWFDSRTKFQMEEDVETSGLYFFTARTPSGEVHDHHQLVEWNLPVATLIHSPSGAAMWSVKELIEMSNHLGSVTVNGTYFPVPAIVEYAGRQLCGDVESFDLHPIEGVAINFGPYVLKAKNPHFADKEEKEEAMKKRAS